MDCSGGDHITETLTLVNEYTHKIGSPDRAYHVIIVSVRNMKSDMLWYNGDTLANYSENLILYIKVVGMHAGRHVGR